MLEIYSSEIESSADAVFTSQGILLDSTKDRLDNPRVGEKVKSDYSRTRCSPDKPENGNINEYNMIPTRNKVIFYCEVHYSRILLSSSRTPVLPKEITAAMDIMVCLSISVNMKFP